MRAELPACLVALALLVGACETTRPVAPPADPSRPWSPPEALRREVEATLAQLDRDQAPGLAAPVLDPAHAYSRAELIDLAQRRNPATRAAWEEARQAGEAAGVARSTLLPRLAASVVGGYQRLSTEVPLPLGGSLDTTTEVQGVVPLLTVEWLLFDFGERAALLDASRHLATAANVRFTQAHRQLVFDVSRAFNALAAAGLKEAASGRAVAAAGRLLAAAEAREGRGVGTRIEVAQARQQAAQAELSLVQARGESAAARVALNATLDAPPGTPIRIRDSAGHLPPAAAEDLDRVIAKALARRPDIMAGVAQIQAAQAGERAAAAGLRPKVGLIGALGLWDNQFRINNSDTLGTPIQQTGILLGVTMPLFDGGLRSGNLGSARSRVLAAQAAVATARDAAATEIAAAYEALGTGLASYRAADALVAAATLTAEAADKGLALGIGTLTDAAAAEKALLDAENARTDARRAAFDAAATLAFATAALPAEDGPDGQGPVRKP